MRDKTRRIVAWIAIAFMTLFTAALTAWCFDRTLLNGAIGFAVIFTGGIGLALFAALYLSGKETSRSQDAAVDDDGQDASDAAGDDGEKDVSESECEDGGKETSRQ